MASPTGAPKPEPSPLRERARKLWQAQESEIDMRALAKLLEAEGFANVRPDTLHKWRKRDGWKLDIRALANLASESIAAMDRAIEAGMPVDSIAFETVFNGLMLTAETIGRRLREKVSEAECSTAQHASQLASAIKATAETAVLLHETASKAAILAAKDITPSGELVSSLPSNLSQAIEVFRRAG